MNNLKNGKTIEMLLNIGKEGTEKYLTKGTQIKVTEVEHSELFNSIFITLENGHFYMMTENLDYKILN
jgi:hypothetical protein